MIKLINEGISHIEDLPTDKLIDALRNFERYEISEKIDGSNIRFGRDEEGFYTSRETKGTAPRMRSESDYDIAFWTTFQRSAHAALEQAYPLMVKSGHLKVGDAVDVEVLFGELPNAVPYDSDVNRIIFLRPVEGSPNIEGLRDSLGDKTVQVTIEAPFTLDGKTIRTRRERHAWKFAKTPTIDATIITGSEAFESVQAKINELESFLEAPSGIMQFSNLEIISMPLNRRPEGVDTAKWRELKEKVKELKAQLNSKLYYEDRDTGERSGFKHELKQLLLNDLVRAVRSEFGPEIEDGGWIEGVVFRDRESGEMFKIVDKDMFTAVKDFIWQVRSNLSDKPMSVTRVESFLGKLLVNLASSLGNPQLGTTQQLRILKKSGNTPEEILANISAGKDISKLKPYWQNAIAQAEDTLDMLLDQYQKERDTLSMTAPNNRQFTYTDEVHRRTLQVFANIKKTITDYADQINKANSVEDLTMVLIGHKLSELK